MKKITLCSKGTFCISLLLYFCFNSHTSAQCAVNLGAAAQFALFTAEGAIGNTGISSVNGDIGTNVGDITGFAYPTLIYGTIYSPGDLTNQASLDVLTAYNTLFNTPTTNDTHTPAFGGNETLTAGVYSITAAGSVAGTLTLDGGGNPEALFLFKFGGAFTTGAASTIILTNGTKASNVFWIANGAISMAATNTISGTFIAVGAVSMGAGSNLNGKLYSTAGAISIDSTIIDSNGFGKVTIADGDWNQPATWCNNTIPTPGESVTINHDVTVNTAVTLRSIVINSGKTILASDDTPRTITISNGGFITNNGTFTAGTGTVAFAGAATVTGTIAFNNTTMAGGINFGSGSTINNTLTINNGGFVNTNAPTYASESTLRYNSGFPYGRGIEWSTTSGSGYPHHVQISNNGTLLSLGANSGGSTARKLAGNLTIDAGTTLTMAGDGEVMTQTVTVKGNYTNNGATILSTAIGGDLILEGNLTDNATITANGRALFFRGGNTQSIDSDSNPLDLDVMRIEKSGGEIILWQNLLVDETANPIQFAGTSSILNLNGFEATFGKIGVASSITMNSTSSLKGSSTSALTLLGTGEFGTIRFDNSIPGTTNVLQNLTIDRTTTGSVTLGNALVVNNALSLLDGILNVGANPLTFKGNISNTSGGIEASTGTIIFDGAAPQTLPATTFSSAINKLTLLNSSAVTFNQALTITSEMNLSSGTLNMQTHSLSGNTLTTSGTGKLQTQNTSATPLPSGRSWSFEVEMNAEGNQTVPQGNYATLLLNTVGSKSIADNCAIAGDLIVTAPATATVGNTITFNGSSTQNIAGLPYNNITFSEAGTKTFTSNSSISSTGAITFGLGSGTIDFDGSSNDLNFMLKSDSNGTARVGQIENFTLLGNVTTQRFIPQGKRAFRFLTATVTSTESIRINWQANGTTTVGIATQITGTGGSTNGFDTSNTNNPSLFIYNNQVASGTGWTAVTSTNTTSLEAGVGYRILLRGDRNVDLSATSAATMNHSVTLNTKGILKTGTVVYNDASGPVAINNTTNTTTDNYSLVGNPFMSPIDWHTIDKTGLEDSYYAWDANMGTDSQRGRYVAYSQTADTNNNENSEVGQFIQSGQAFFVRNTTPGTAGTLTITEAHKTANTVNVFRQATSNRAKLSVVVYEAASLSSGGLPIDGTVAVFDTPFSNAIENGDVVKLNAAGENIALNRNNLNLAIEAVAPVESDDELLLKLLQFTASKNYAFKIEATNFDPTVTAYLVDNFLNTFTTIDLTTSAALPFSTTTNNASFQQDRFKIVFNPTTLTVSDFNLDAIAIYPNPIQSNRFTIALPIEVAETTEIKMYNVLGQKIAIKTTLQTHGIVVEPYHNLNQGVYLIHVTSNGKTSTKKITVN